MEILRISSGGHKVSKNILDQRNQGDFSADTDPKLKNVVEGSKIKTYTKSSLVL